MTLLTEALLAAIKSIPEGRVASYGAVARMAGQPGAARQVARVLHALSAKEGLPWHRILRADGSIALPEGGGAELQRRLLEAEGVVFGACGKVDMRAFAFPTGRSERP
jgi:methylated-DNA-protein-cysteine methyltransferase-like protein